MLSISATGFLPKYHLSQGFKQNRVGPRILEPAFYTQKASPPSVDDCVRDNVLDAFLRERKSNGDFVAKISDGIWFRGMSNSSSIVELDDSINFQAKPPLEEENVGGFLKLKGNNEWLLGDDNSAPMNKKIALKELEDDSESRKRLNILRYEALKRELFLLTAGIGTACTGYCLFTLSIQAAVSYACGVLLSCLYFHLLCQHADNISREAIPQIFAKKKSKKIGIRSGDLQDAFERTVRGSSIALSSPRLVIPAAIYAVWEVSQHFWHHVFDFQLVPAMVGLFAYKAAALVQVYRDNKDLQLIFPETD